MVAALSIPKRGLARAQVREETARAMELLDTDVVRAVLSVRADAVLQATLTELRATLDRDEPTVALVGERTSGALLDSWLGSRVFGDADLRGPGPLIVIRGMERAACHVVRLDGAREEIALDDVEARDESRASTPPSQLAPRPERASRVGIFRRLWSSLLAFFGSWFGVPPRVLPANAGHDEPIEPRVEERRENERLACVRSLVDRSRGASEVSEVLITHPIRMVGAPITLIDLRGTMQRDAGGAWKVMRRRIDLCVLVVESDSLDAIEPSTPELARELATMAPHLWIVGEHSADALARSLEIDAARIVRVAPPLDPEGLADTVLDHRAAVAGIRAIAASRLAQQEIELALEQADAADREVIERVASHCLSRVARRRDETRQRVGGAIAGRATRILERVLGVLDTELARLREERVAAVASAASIDALRAEVVAVGSALRALRAELAAFAESLVHEALADLGPALLDELERRVDAVVEDVRHVDPGRPVWPAAPRVEVPEDGLVAHDTLAGGETLRADIRWLDSLFRSVSTVRQRCAEELAGDLDRLAQAARAEILDFEPQIARRLQSSLEAWIESAGGAFTEWLDATVESEREARDAARIERTAELASHRDALSAAIRRIGELNRTLARG